MSRRGCRKSAVAPAQPCRYRYVRSFSNRIILLLSSIMVAASLLTILLYWLLYPILPSEMYAPIHAVALSLAFCLLAGCLLSVILSKKIYRPFEQLIRATEKIAQGDFKVRLAETADPGSDLGALQRSFNHMASELDSTEIFRNDFINNFSHEFKTPLISIRGFARLLQNDDLTPEQRRAYADTVVQQSQRLAAMSTHILELAQYENTEIVSGKTLYSLDEQLRRCVRQQERDWLKKGLTVEGDLDRADYYGNEELVEHIWSNLLSNAIRFTPAGGQITVVLRQGEEEVTVSISDTGIGMDEETQRHIFDKFYRAAPYPDDRGNGLGLSIVRRVVKLCGGQVAVFSRPGNGSTFTVTLPAARE